MAAKVLLVDGDKDLRNCVQEILKSSGYLVAEAADCQSALSLLEGERFDLILLDIALPDRSGFSILEYCQETRVASKIIVITGTVELGIEIKSASLGVQDCVTKPYDPDDLLKFIKHVLSFPSQEKLKLQIIKAADFIKSTPSGDLDVKASRQVLAQIAAAGANLHDYTVLIDLRQVKARLSTTDTFNLATELLEYGETFHRKTAVLARAEQDIDLMTFFETVAKNRGFRVKAFTDFEEAMTWLLSIASESMA